MFTILGTDTAAVIDAAAWCDLTVTPGPRAFARGAGPLTLPPGLSRADLARPAFVLGLTAEVAAACSRAPHEVGVFRVGGTLYAVWDGDRDGFGLTAYIGECGERLRTSYVIDALATAAAALGLAPAGSEADCDGTLTLEYADAMSQKKITVRVDKTGATTVATEGFQGTACKDATAQLEKALGTVKSDTPTQEQYAPPEQVTTIGGG